MQCPTPRGSGISPIMRKAASVTKGSKQVQEYILEMRNITKEFPGVKALDNVSFQVKPGEIKALVGENGAGKSTLMKLLSAVHPYGSYTGDILVDGKVHTFHSIEQSEQAGIAIIHQELALIPLLSIAENVFLGKPKKTGGAIDWNKTRAATIPLLERIGLHDDPDTPINQLGVGKQQLVEIAKALAKDCRILILDEPTAALNEQDSRNLLNLLKTLKEGGMTCILISHKLNEICYVADSITVLRDGKTVADFPDASKVTENEIIRCMVGRELNNRYPEKTNHPAQEICLEVKNWTVHNPDLPEKEVISDVSLYLRRGEVVGLSGLMGAGRTELAMSIFGKSYGCNISGQVIKDGKPIDVGTVPKAIRHGIAYLSEDRKNYGLVLGQTISKNISLANLSRISRSGVLNLNREIKETAENARQFNVKCASIFQQAGELSGGNQQKVVLAKWMFNLPDVLILDEPTRGIDVGAKYDIYCIINELAAAGKCVLMISSELPEILGVCDRVYVMGDGQIKGEMPIEQASQGSIMRLLV